jgi:hypothetical protein
LYTCLALGFRGRYGEESEELRLKKQDVLAKCPRSLKEPQTPLCPEAYNVRERNIHKLPSILKWRHMLIFFAMLVGINIVIDRLVIWSYLTEPVKDVSHLAATLLSTGEMSYFLSPHRASPKRIEPYPTEPHATEKAVEETSQREMEKKSEVHGYTIQVSVYYNRGKAEEFSEVLKGKGYDAYVIQAVAPSGRIWYLVRMGHYELGEITRARKAASEFTEKENMEVYVTNLTK